ncbi:MAG: hypothetical protein GC164_12805 [Phycisphaera sp.]|nr:hypothetical protein [Phycisphaera sp.]
MTVITLTTDFGQVGTFVGQMKGAILALNPNQPIVDFCHTVERHDILSGAVTLEAVLGVFPNGSVHVAVVDPGVGSNRRAIAIRTDAGYFIGPDNGLFTTVLERTHLQSAVCLDNPRYHRHQTSHTFHGRDIFAPVAAHIANGVALEQIGSPVSDLVRIDIPKPEELGNVLAVQVIAVDSFGNLVTNLNAARLNQWVKEVQPTDIRIAVGLTTVLGIHKTFSDVEPDRLVAYVGSSGYLEVAVRDGNAAQSLGVSRGAVITLEKT